MYFPERLERGSGEPETALARHVAWGIEIERIDHLRWAHRPSLESPAFSSPSWPLSPQMREGVPFDLDAFFDEGLNVRNETLPFFDR